MNRLSCIAIVSCGLVACALPHRGLQPGNQRVLNSSWCDALERVGIGDKLQVTVTGIYALSGERNVFYDPLHPLCRLDVASDTEVRFEPSARVDPGLHKALEEDYRAYVTVRGVLFGPPAVKSGDDSSLPEIMVYANRIPGRYGHLAASRTLFMISDVLRWRRVPPDVPSIGALKLRPVSAIPELVAAAVPGYPHRALRTQTTGTVVVKVTVKKGQVTETKVASGDRLLAPSVLENIKTWKFKDDAEARFSTTYSFLLELRETGSDKNPRVELHLPVSVKITAPLDAW